ncbi:MAG: tRNA (adenosine(37)-N6)-threonylcarbamoyltransferase complex ATPase subunit type 1 TsaE [Dehalococcoidia bacterium]|nr:tRNA (adenosine(37)-N6)-threonylcarbamoyltransferase complex ATPase subunit type 1 TsaE [Dehalococcoidia bacterium]
MSDLEVVTRSEQGTRRIGSRLGRLSLAGDVILLVGDLGAGKTCLTQGIAAGLGIEEWVVSPTFMLVRQYRGRLPLYHIDFYRLDPAEAAELGLEEYCSGAGVCVVEWADRAVDVLPREHLLVTMQALSASERRLTFTPHGSRFEQLVKQLRRSRLPLKR